jgi:hypothetical protein
MHSVQTLTFVLSLISDISNTCLKVGMKNVRVLVLKCKTLKRHCMIRKANAAHTLLSLYRDNKNDCVTAIVIDLQQALPTFETLVASTFTKRNCGPIILCT